MNANGNPCSSAITTPAASFFIPAANFLWWRDQAKAFEHIAAFTPGIVNLTASGGPERLSVGAISAELSVTLGVAPALGRAFTPEEDTYGGAPVVILSDSLWRRRFNSDPQVIGRALTLYCPDQVGGSQSWTVIGIMPPGFRFPEESDLWLPLALNVAQEMGGEKGAAVSVIGRLKPGITQEAARADLSVIIERQRQAFPQLNTDTQFRVVGLSEGLVGNVRMALLILFGAVAFVLLIACANVANLLLARSAARQKEMAIRAAVGAGRLRLVRQLLTESLLLSVAGAAAGLLVAKWSVGLIVAMSPAGIPRIEESGLDGRVLIFTCLVMVLVGLIAGIFPARQASKVNVNETLKAQTTASGHVVRGSGRKAISTLMIAELALALVLLVGAGLMVKSFLRLMAVPKGFNPDGVLTLMLSPSFTRYPLESPRRRAYFQEVLARVQALLGIQSASLTSFFPLSGSPFAPRISRLIEGRPGLGRGNEQPIQLNHSSPDYFQTIGIQLRAGRHFTTQDGYDAPRVAIINETLARRFLPNENPIGQRLLIRPRSEPPPTIVGVVGDTHHSGLDKEVNPEVYLPYMQYLDIEPGFHLAVRVSPSQNNPASRAVLAASIRDQVLAVDPNEPVDQVVTMDERLSKSVAGRRYQMLLLGVFAAMALVIATVGIYGVISYAVSQRTQEIGIRMALGAQARGVLNMVIWHGLRQALIGVALGLAAAFALTRRGIDDQVLVPLVARIRCLFVKWKVDHEFDDEIQAHIDFLIERFTPRASRAGPRTHERR